MRHDNLSRFTNIFNEHEYLWRDISSDAIKTLEESMRVRYYLFQFYSLNCIFVMKLKFFIAISLSKFQKRPQLSEVTPCQVLINLKSLPQLDEMIGVDNREDFENLLKSIEEKGSDPILFIQDKLQGKHISGNHRYEIKQKYMDRHKAKFDSKPFWYLTLTSIFIGLRPDQAR